MSSDFSILPIIWNTANLDKQYQDVRLKVEQYHPECVVILGVPRHHAKKIAQQDWTKDYHLSKERRANATSKLCSVVYSRYPFTSQEWIGVVANETTHVTEICVPIGQWKPHRSPIELLQEYGLEYDEVATITIVAASGNSELEKLQQAFDTTKIKNTIVFITSASVLVDAVWWKDVSNTTDAIELLSEPKN